MRSCGMESSDAALDENAVLDRYLDLGSRVNGSGSFEYWSCYAAAVHDARFACGQDKTGRWPQGREVEAGRWLGAVGWLCLFDQMGQTIRRAGSNPPNIKKVGERFKRALTDFAPGLAPDDRDVLYALRNSLAHSYSLIGRTPDRTKVIYRFQLTNEPSSDLIWADGGDTVVNLRELARLGDRVVRDVAMRHQNGGVTLNVEHHDAAEYAKFIREWFVSWPVTRMAVLDMTSPPITGAYEPNPSAGASAVPPFTKGSNEV